MYPSPFTPHWAAAAFDLKTPVPVAALLAYAFALIASEGANDVWVYGGFMWLFVALAMAWWAHKASPHWDTRFRTRDDWRDAWDIVAQMQGVGGVDQLAEATWEALSDASFVGQNTSNQVHHHARELLNVARRDPGSSERIERVIETLRAVREEAQERD